MVVGIGMDLQSHDEMDVPLGDPFVTRAFTESERAELASRIDAARHAGDAAMRAERLSYLAGRFAVKEAVVKALGIDTDRVRLDEIETTNDSFGVPHIELTGSLARIACDRGAHAPVLVTITHKDGMSAACVLLQG